MLRQWKPQNFKDHENLRILRPWKPHNFTTYNKNILAGGLNPDIPLYARFIQDDWSSAVYASSISQYMYFTKFPKSMVSCMHSEVNDNIISGGNRKGPVTRQDWQTTLCSHRLSCGGGGGVGVGVGGCTCMYVNVQDDWGVAVHVFHTSFTDLCF